ncbi:MAG TPA: Gfo/Idh/MocA family oxidoreductase [Ignavibacteriaceae bacterium]|nr:Gfo/Idh/MocA family oxidoreductase [Ignavibacteriaceae bacterium]
MDKNTGIAIVGAGRWGMNHVKTAYQLLGKNLLYVCDFNPAAEKKVKEVSSEINFVSELGPIIQDKNVKGVIIATPAETHYDVAVKILEAGKDVLIEKPLTLYVEDAEKLVDLADSLKRKVMVGHILLYHPAIIKIKQLIGEGKIGTLQYIYSNRLNLGAIRSEENILWSFAPHDISIIQYLTESNPVEISASGASFVQNNIEDTTITYLSYPNNVHAHIFVSWLHPFKEQRLVIIGNKGMFVFEDSLKTDKLKFYEKGFSNLDGNIQKFESDFEVVQYDDKAPLQEEQKHFIDCIENNLKPLTDGRHAIEVLSILEEATKKIKNKVDSY